VGDKHGPNRLASYLQIHETIMEQFLRGDFVVSEELSIEPLGDGFLWMTGSVHCVSGIRIDVWKRLRLIGDGSSHDPFVQTVGYSYDAVLGSLGNIFRYDSPHQDHNRFHHVHRYDVLRGDVHGVVHRVEPQDGWPTLGEVVEEVRGWFYDNADEILALTLGDGTRRRE